MNIGLIGFGNLGKAFVSGLLKSGLVLKQNLYVCAKSKQTLKLAADIYQLNACKDINTVLENADILIFAVKPASFDNIVENSNKAFIQNKPIISFMAGICSSHIRNMTETIGEVIRAMPNLAISDGNGIIGYTKTDNTEIVRLFNSLGFAFLMQESEVEKITAFSACGLGFAAYILDSFVSAGKMLGFDETLSLQIVRQNFISAAESEKLKDLIAAVATKGGATEQIEGWRLNMTYPKMILFDYGHTLFY